MIQGGLVLEKRLTAIVDLGADRFDPARFCYISALARRAADKPGPVRRSIEKKALAALDDYQAGFEKAHLETECLITRIAAKHPDAAERMRRRLAQGDLDGARKLARFLERGHRRRLLADLNNQLQAGAEMDRRDATRLSFEERLRQQETAVVASVGHCRIDDGRPTVGPDAELRAYRLFKKEWARRHADRLVVQSIQNCPQDPGPLNGQMLATRCLRAMRRLSPAYLNRLVSYIETLLWLETAGMGANARSTKSTRRT